MAGFREHQSMTLPAPQAAHPKRDLKGLVTLKVVLRHPGRDVK